MKEIIAHFDMIEDPDSFHLAYKGRDYWLALWDIYQMLRKWWKYEEVDDKQYEVIEKIREEFHQILEDRNVNLDEIH